MIAIIDYDAGNLRSVEKALQTIGCDTLVTRDRDEIMAADKIILPGVFVWVSSCYLRAAKKQKVLPDLVSFRERL